MAYAAYAAAQVEWQRGLAELIIEGRPDFERAAMVQRDLQVAYIKRRTTRFEYLLDQEPSRIVLTQGLSAFLNFGWSDEDTEALVEADPRYAALERSVAELREGNDDHPGLAEFQRVLSEYVDHGHGVSSFAERPHKDAERSVWDT